LSSLLTFHLEQFETVKKPVVIDEETTQVLSSFNVDEFVELMKVELCASMSMSSLLNLRIRGVQYMNEMVTMAVQKEKNDNSPGHSTSTYKSYYGRKAEPATNFITPEWFINYFASSPMIPLCLGDTETLEACGLQDTHTEVLKRSEGLLTFLSEYGGLNEKHIQMLWHFVIPSSPSPRRTGSSASPCSPASLRARTSTFSETSTSECKATSDTRSPCTRWSL
jgi:hypothetical protein